MGLFILASQAITLNAVEVSITPYSFSSPNGETYGELHIYLVGESLVRVPKDSNTFSSSAEIFILVTDTKTEKVVFGDRFLLHGPVSEKPEDFFDVRRFPIENGDYLLSYDVVDYHDSINNASGNVGFSVDFLGKGVEFSSIQLLSAASRSEKQNSRFVKSGYRLENVPFSYYPPHTEEMIVYFEIYGLDQYFVDEEFFALGFSLVRRGNREEVFTTFSRRPIESIHPVLRRFDISEVGSGEYFLEVGVYNREREKIASKNIAFYRHNPMVDEKVLEEQLVTFENSFVQEIEGDELVYSLKAIAPVINPLHVERLNNILKNKRLNEMRHFLFEMWCTIDPRDPEFAYQQYMEVARAVDKMFYSGFGSGFETDKGRIYLKYGRPDNMTDVQTENDAPPYEIWTYSRLPGTGQTDVKFVFYNPSLAGNMYELLHTNARGELNNPRWMQDLYRNAPGIHEGPNPQEARGIKDGINRRAIDFFRDN